MFVSKSTENGLVGREEIAKVVKGLTVGEEGAMIRDRINILKERAPKALTEAGSSTKTMSELVPRLKNKKSLCILNHLCLFHIFLL